MPDNQLVIHYITVCRSGARSGMAKTILTENGIIVYNGGAWNTQIHKI
jgi:rhodanese-related sulfurtransferase